MISSTNSRVIGRLTGPTATSRPAVERSEPVHLFGPVGPQDQVQKRGFFFFELFLLLLLAEVRIDADVVLPLVLAQVQDLEGPVVASLGFQVALDADHSFAGGVDGEFSQVADDPFATQLFRHRRGCAGATEEVGHEVAFVGRGADDAFKQRFGFLSGIVNSLFRRSL